MLCTPAPAGLRRRAVPALAAAVTVAAGLSLRSVQGGDLAKYAGDALYALLVFWLVLVVAPRTRGWVAAVVAFGFSVAIELFQLTGVPAELGGHSAFARLVLGTTFNAPDLPFYAVGAAAGWTLHRVVDDATCGRVPFGTPQSEPRGPFSRPASRESSNPWRHVVSTPMTAPNKFSALHPVVLAIVGVGIHALVMVLGYQYNLGYAGLAAGAAVVVILLGSWAWAGGPTRLERTSLGLAIAGAVALPVWWAGWPLVLGLPAAGLAVAYRQRVGSLSVASTIGLTVGLIAFGAGVIFALTG